MCECDFVKCIKSPQEIQNDKYDENRKLCTVPMMFS